jgi:non-heme chloroperoxidase
MAGRFARTPLKTRCFFGFARIPLYRAWPWNGNDLDTYADGEVARYIGRHGTHRIAKAVLGAIPPLMLKTPANPDGTPKEVFDQLRAEVQADRSQFWKDLRCRFTAPTGRGPKSHQGCASHAGARG